MSNYIITPDGELYHHGVKGMKWGVRKKSNPAKERYKAAKKKFRQEQKTFRKTSGHGFGIKGIAKYNKAEKRLNKAEMDLLSEKARYKKSKSAKAEARVYRNAMARNGLPGSYADQQSGGRSTRVYNQIVKDKGKKYADKTMKSVQDIAIGKLVGAAIVTAGAMAVNIYTATRD